jgi:hypothetical protein
MEEAVTNSTTVWQENLQALFDNAKDWFPDVVWEVLDEDQPGAEPEEVWGHKGQLGFVWGSSVLVCDAFSKRRDSRILHAGSPDSERRGLTHLS